MGKLSGTVLILAGVSIAAYTLSAQQDAGPLPGPIAKAPAAPASVTAENTTPAQPPPMPAASTPAAAPTPASAPSPSGAQGAQSTPGTQNAQNAPGAAGAASQPPKAGTPPAASPPPAILAPSPAGPPKLRPGAPTAVRVAEAPPRLPVGETAATASPPLDRPALTREIQRQLKRIGCYQGEPNGVWTPSVRQALKAVTDHVNASLPTDRPDPVLLAMVQGQEPGACGASCPKGQSRAADGRCLPAALVANAGKARTQTTASAQTGGTKTGQAQVDPVRGGQAKGGQVKNAEPAAGVSAVPADAAVPPPTEGRMSLAGPPVGAKPNAPRQANARHRRTRVVSTPPKAAAYYRPAGPRARQRSAQRSGGMPFWAIPFFTP
jgi:hypothetical protein